MSRETEKSRARRLLATVAEFSVALVLVLVAFVSILGILGMSFPDGATLRDLIQPERFREFDGSASDFVVEVLGGDDSIPIIAKLSSMHRKVKDRPAGAIIWDDAQQGEQLMQRHAVRTFSASGATIAFDENNQLELGENSLLILKDVRELQKKNRVHAQVIVVDGEFHGRFSGQKRDRVQLEMFTEKASYHVQSSRAAAADFRVTVNPDRSSTLSVYDGVASVEVAGRVIPVDPQHSMTIDAEGNPGELISLPAIPRAIGPEEGASYLYRSIPPEVAFSWTPAPDADAYRLVLARDPEFANVVMDETVATASFAHANLRAGTYYWKVSSRKGHGEGPATEPRSLNLGCDRQPPPLQVEFPDELGPLRAVLRGQTERGSRVFVRDVEIATSDLGRFEHELELTQGLNVVVVEAIDTAGNVTYLSKLLNAPGETRFE